MAVTLQLHDLLVRDYFTSNIPKLRLSDNLGNAVKAFLQYRLDVACVVEESDRLLGIVSKYAVFRALLQGAAMEAPIASIIRRRVVTIDVHDSLENARDILIETGVGHGVVVDRDGRVLGVMGKSDIIQGFLFGTELLANQLESLIEHLQDAVISVDADVCVTTFNRAAEQLLHCPRQTVLQKPASVCFPELAESLEDAVRQHSMAGPLRIEMGSIVVTASFIPIAFPNGMTTAMAVLRDITSLETVAKELETTKNLEHTLQRAVAISYDGVAIMDAKGRFTVANDAFLELFHLRKERIVGKHWSAVAPDLLLQDEWSDEQEEGQIRTLGGQLCLVTQEPIVRAGKRLGVIVKIIFRQLKQWRAVFRHLEELESELHYYRGEIRRMNALSNAFDRIIGMDESMLKLKQQALLAAQWTSTVLITGESGTGKELFAEAIHEESGRKGNFIKVNCAAIPAELLESEFFGYADGAYTGARRGGKPGKFELAHGGTIFLDEMGDMPPALQAKLLRVLQERTFERIGDTKTIEVDVRIIAATNHDLRQMMREGTFREDLYYRIHVVHLDIPPLRKRIQDLPLLCEHLIKKLNKKMNKHVLGVTPQAASAMQTYAWPGNIRQLENVLEMAMNLGVDGWIETEHLSDEVSETGPAASAGTQTETEARLREPFEAPGKAGSGLQRQHGGAVRPFQSSIESWEKQYLLNALRESRGNRTKAAKLLGISRSALYQKLRKYRIKEETTFEFP
ncbi:MAG: sigma 54-interacting transcriptional regulator [Bacilli bacterium]